MAQKDSFTKMVLIDVAAGFCLVGVVLFGWLPGPGGIPLLLIALGLLARNHTWAQRWLNTVKEKGVTVRNKIFSRNPWIRLFYDFASIAIAALGVYLLIRLNNWWVNVFFTLSLIISISLFLFNRDRIDKLMKVVKKKS